MHHARLWLRNAFLIDGTGGKGHLADIQIVGERISAIKPKGASVPTADDVDLDGAVVCPGFIDVHSHADNSPFLEDTDQSKILQGVTTEVVGNCGFSLAPVTEEQAEVFKRYSRRLFPELPWSWGTMAAFFQATDNQGYVTNRVPLVGHHTLRIAAMGMTGRPPTTNERKAMANYLDEAIAAGAFGLSTGLIYPPGLFAGHDEVTDLVARLPENRLYATHMRGESGQLLHSLDEAIAVADATTCRLQISHLKVAGKSNWGGMATALDKLDSARDRGLRIRHDVYPYTASSTMLTATLPPWFQDGGDAEVLRRLEDRHSLDRLAEEIQRDDGSWENKALGAGWEGIVIASSTSHSHDGKDINTVAAELGVSPFEALVHVLLSESLQVSMIVHSMQQSDLELALSSPQTMIGSDGLPPGTGGKPHPRMYGTFPRIISRYVRDRGVLTLEDAIHKMTGLPALTFGLVDRGIVSEGNVADLIVFDREHIRDRATYQNPTMPPEGILSVLLAGRSVVESGRFLGVRRGQRLLPAS